MTVAIRLRRARRLAGALVVLAAVAGCGNSAPPAPDPQAPAPAPAATAAAQPADGPLPASHPTRLVIDSIGVDSGLIDLGVQPDGTMEVPADGSTAGWYAHSPTPGEIGPAVLAAHVDWKGSKGVFYDLRRIATGDDVTVERADGRAAHFTVRRVAQYPKDAFPTTAVYGDVATPQLRLITCGGDFDVAAHSYRDNVVVYAEMAR
jgi:Sortase domain